MDFTTSYNESLLQIKENNYKLAYEKIKNAKQYITTKNDKQQYYFLLISILKQLNYKDEGSKMSDKIILSNDFDWHVQNEFIRHSSLFCQSITKNNTLSIKLDCPTPKNYHISSASIINNDVLTANLRCINYVYTKEGDYISRDDDHIVRTTNYLITLDQDWMIQSMVNIKECQNLKIYPCHILGMEDVRLFGPCYYFCTRLDVTENHIPKVCLGHYNVQGETTKMIILGDVNKTEKNWLPIYKNNTCHVIYSFHPLTIFNLDVETGEMTEIVKRYTNQNLSSFRGSAVPIRYKEGWLCTIHQVYYHKKRIYLHRFVWLSDDYMTLKYSKCFYFNKVGVEFNLGIACHQNGLIITFSVDDAHSTLTIIPYDDINDLLQL